MDKKERFIQAKIDARNDARKRLMSMTDHQIIEASMPAHVMALLMNSVKKQGNSIREDVWRAINLEAIKSLAGRSPNEVKRLAGLIDQAGKDIFKDIRFEGPQQALLCWSHAIMKVVTEGMHPDPGCQAAVMALSITEEAKESNDWEYDPIATKLLGNRLFDRMRLAGFFVPVIQIDNLETIT